MNTFSAQASGNVPSSSLSETSNSVSTSTVRVVLSKAQLESTLLSFNLAVDGDLREKSFCEAGLSQKLPAYESVWRILIVPATGRLDNTVGQFRANVANRIKTMCQFFYSMMRSLSLAHKKINEIEDGSMEAYIMHAENALEQFDLFLLYWLQNFKESRPPNLRKLDLGDRELTVRAIRRGILKTNFSGSEWGSYMAMRNRNQKVRDIFLHGPLVVTIENGGNTLFPSYSSLIKDDPWTNAQFWRNLSESRSEISVTAFRLPNDMRSEHFDDLINCLNRFLSTLIVPSKIAFARKQSQSFYALSIQDI